MNYIFLDLDGVLNNFKYLLHSHKNHLHDDISDGNLSDFLRIIEAFPETRIVLSSSWRHSLNEDNSPKGWTGTNLLTQNMIDKFWNHGLKIYDRTPSLSWTFHRFGLNGWTRRYEIVDYLTHNIDPKNDTFIILDDENIDEDGVFGDKFIRTNSEFGLTSSDVDKAIKILNEQLEAKKSLTD